MLPGTDINVWVPYDKKYLLANLWNMVLKQIYCSNSWNRGPMSSECQ